MLASKSLWIFNQYAITPDMPGGSRHYDLSKELVKYGYDVTIFASSFHYTRHEEMKLFRNERWRIEIVNGIRFVWIKNFGYQRNNWRRIVNILSYTVGSYLLARKISKVKHNVPIPDVVIGSSFHLLAVLSAFFVAKYYQSGFIMEVRDLWPQTLVDLGTLKAQNPIVQLMYAIEKFLYLRAQRIITLLPLADRYIIARGVNSDKIVWIPNGVDLCKFPNVKACPTSKADFTVMYLGGHCQTDGLHVLIDAAKVISDSKYEQIRFCLVGDGPEKQKLIEQRDELNLNNTNFNDSIPKSEVSNFISKSDVCLVSSLGIDVYKYGLSFNKLFDYLATSKPIIMIGNPANNIVKEVKCGFSIPANDPNALANAIITLYQMPLEQRLSMGERGREYVEKHHDIRTLADKLSKCIEEVNSG